MGMAQRGIVAYEAFRSESGKFDYFMCALIGAVFAYIAESYRPHELTFGPTLLEPTAVVLLAIALFCGVKRLERVVVTLMVNHTLLDDAETRAKLVEALNSAEFPVLRSTGELLEREDCTKRVVELRQREAAHREMIARHKRAAGRYYSWRQKTMFLGLGALVLHRLLLPYA